MLNLMPHDIFLVLVLASGWVEVELLLVLAMLKQHTKGR